jgi:hypothetical protein
MTRPAGWRGLVAVAVCLAVAGAVAFGLWHLVVGGLVNGTPRAGTFGLVLASAAGTLLVGLVAGLRRLRPG